MCASSVRASKNGIYFDVHVTPSAGEDSVRCIDGVLKVRTSEPADRDRANGGVVRILKPYFGACEIASGHRSRRKTIFARNMGLVSYNAVLGGLAGAQADE